MRTRLLKQLALAALAACLALVAQPAPVGAAPSQPDPYFAALNQALRADGTGLPCSVIDLDRLDRNIALAKSRIRPPRSLRIVVKSLPSLGLLHYVLDATGTRRVMVFHAPQINLLFGDLDILFGKPMPAQAARAGRAGRVRRRARPLRRLRGGGQAGRAGVVCGSCPLTLNSGGSRTYALYERVDTPVNDLAMGSGFVMPSDFTEEHTFDGHQPALYLAIPILKKLETPPIPFMDPFWGMVKAVDPGQARGYFIYGGVWDAEIESPRGLKPGWFYEPVIRNLLPNQSLVSGPADVPAEVGDYVFVRPHEGDGMAVYQDIATYRAGKLTGHWHPLPFLN